MIDIHCHVLPNVDDGAKDITTSLKMLKIAEGIGIDRIIATPHFYRNYFEVEYEEVIRKTMELNNKAQENGINIKILPGQEVFIDKYTIQMYEEGRIGRLNNSRYMLVEFPLDELPKYALDIIYELRIRNVVPIIAHPERYKYVIHKPSVLNDFIEEGCLFQINAGSITGDFGKKIYKTSKILLKNGICDFIGSDAHSYKRRSPKLLKCMEEVVEKKYKKVFENVDINCRKLSEQEIINREVEKIKEKKRFFGI